MIEADGQVVADMPGLFQRFHLVSHFLIMTTESVHGQGEDALPEVVVDAWTFHLIFCAEIMTQVGDLPDEVILFLFVPRV